MKAISVHVAEDDYRRFKLLAAMKGRPVAELIREAMSAFLHRERMTGRPLTEIPAHDSGPMLEAWTRAEVFDEMLEKK